jgi:Flp pilus assembly protein TadG
MLNRSTTQRRGAIAVKVALLLIPTMGFMALAVDYGYLAKVRTELQNSADAAALAAARELVPAPDGKQNLDAVRATAQAYAQKNVAGQPSFKVADADIEIGRYDSSSNLTNKILSKVKLLKTGTSDTVQVTVRRDNSLNSPVQLFFARAIGIPNIEMTATATAIIPPAGGLGPGSGVFPFAMSKVVWDTLLLNEQVQFYDGKLVTPNGLSIPGNWGTVDIGEANNSTKDLSDQIINGLRQKDLDALYKAKQIDSPTQIDTAKTMVLEGDTGLSSGIKDAVASTHGTDRIIPIYDKVTGNGNNSKFTIVGWGVVRVIDSKFSGSKNTYITVEKSFTYDGRLRAVTDLSNTSNTIQGAYAAPALIE